MHAFALGETGETPFSLEPGVLAQLHDTRRQIAAQSALMWDEHCSECAMPSCFASCSLYTPRGDLKCRRFARGIEALVVKGSDGAPIRLMSIVFRQWGKLEARGVAALVSRPTAALMEAGAPVARRIVDRPWLNLRTRRRAGKAVDLTIARVAAMTSRRTRPELFVMEVINPGAAAVRLTLTVKRDAPKTHRLFQSQAVIEPGYNRHCFSADEIFALAGDDGPMLFQIEPADSAGPAPALIFGVTDFVALRPGARLTPTGVTPEAQTAPASKVKCVVWDLDNVMWWGTLIEDGASGVRLNPKAAAAVVEVDRRGILNSIASKNSGDEPEAVLQRFGLWDYFLHPQIHWGPKSGSLRAIAEALNIGIDTLVFIDDQPFERGEVAQALPMVEVFDVDILDTWRDHPRFDVTVTPEGRQRRAMYQVEQVRHAASAAAGDYNAFLKSCNIRIKIVDLDEASLNRAFELTERTNQLNYSGVRLSRSDLEAKMASPDYAVHVLSVADRFGDYGVIGLSVLNLDAWRVECFFMSCRVQRKKVEHAYFGVLLGEGRRRDKARLEIVYRPTARNEPSREVLEDEMALDVAARDGGERQFYRATCETIADGDIVKVDDQSGLRASATRVPISKAVWS